MDDSSLAWYLEELWWILCWRRWIWADHAILMRTRFQWFLEQKWGWSLRRRTETWMVVDLNLPLHALAHWLLHWRSDFEFHQMGKEKSVAGCWDYAARLNSILIHPALSSPASLTAPWSCFDITNQAGSATPQTSCHSPWNNATSIYSDRKSSFSQLSCGTESLHPAERIRSNLSDRFGSNLLRRSVANDLLFRWAESRLSIHYDLDSEARFGRLMTIRSLHDAFVAWIVHHPLLFHRVNLPCSSTLASRPHFLHLPDSRCPFSFLLGCWDSHCVGCLVLSKPIKCLADRPKS